MSEIKLLMSDNFFKRWEIVLVNSNKTWAIVTEIDVNSGPFLSTYTLKNLKISRWWLIRKVQIWAIKKAFK